VQKKRLIIGENATVIEVLIEEAIAEITAFILELAPANNLLAFRYEIYRN
jgi:hypothetical protein